MFRQQRGVSQVAIALVVILVVAAAASYVFLRPSGGGATPTTSSTNPTTNSTTLTSSVASTPAPPQDLVVAAQNECEAAGSNCLTIVTTQAATNWDDCYGPAFYSDYPWATDKVTYTSASTAAETTQLISDYQVNSVQADIATGTLAGLAPALSAGVMINYTSPMVKSMNYSADAYGTNWITTNLAIVHMIYNPSILTANNLPVPKTWADLANPAYKNQIAFQTATALGITTAEFYYLSSQMSNSSWTTLMQGIAANNPIITQTAANAEQDVISGQVAIGIATFDDYVGDVKEGIPTSVLTFADIEPILYTPGIVAITSGAPHPNMAKLFEAWYISNSGQAAVLCTNHDPYSPVSGGLLNYLPPDYRLVNAYANTALLTDTGSWAALFKNIFGA